MRRKSNQFTKYELLTGSGVREGIVKCPMNAGYAYHHEGDPHYELRLNLFPRVRFYLSRSRATQDQWLVFSKETEAEPGKTKKLNQPIGVGVSLRQYIEIKIPLLSSVIYMRLFPEYE